MSSTPDDTTRIDPFLSQPEEVDAFLPEWEEYKIESLLGTGGMARVYKALDPKLNRYVALKFIRSDDDDLKKRLLREARAQAQIEHDHVCKIYGVGEVEGRSYIAMQLITGSTLLDLAKEMTLEQKALLMQQVAEAVQAAHRLGIIHRDIKPSNIMVERREDGSYRPYITDFGIAREISDSHMTATNVVMGTPPFMAPEQLLGDQNRVDRRTDIYSLGATFYYVLTGQPPFKATGVELLMKLATQDPVPLKKMVPLIPEDLDIIVSKCLEKDPSLRYESARALADDLNRYLEGEPILAHRPNLKYRVLKRIKKNKTVAAIVAVAGLIILALAGFTLLSYLRAGRQVEIARQFSKSIESSDWLMRVAYMAPLHDTRIEKQQVLKRMSDIEMMMKETGKAGVGPGNFALGRGYLALQDYDQARLHLEKAWNSGYQNNDVAGALGLTLGALYKGKLSEIDRISDKETRKVRLQAVEKEFRDPAVHYLRTGSGVGIQSPEYGEALLAYYEKNWDEAIRLAKTSSGKYPWLYEAKMLEGDVHSRLGEQAFQDGKFDIAKTELHEASEDYGSAEATSRSDPALYEDQCTLWRSIMEVEFAVGADPKKSFDASRSYCNKALVANADSATAYGLLAQATWRWGENQYEKGEDPTAFFQEAIENSRKAQQISPDNAYAYYTMGTAYSYLADYQERIGKDPTQYNDAAIKNLLIAIQKDPSMETAWTNLGVSYFSQGAQAMSAGKESKSYFLKAIDAYKKALEISPHSIAPWSNIANAYSNIGSDAADHGLDPTTYIQQSVKNYKKALEINPNHWLIHANLAAVYSAQMSYDLDHGKDFTTLYRETISECETSTKLRSDNPYSAINLANAHLIYGQFMLNKQETPLPYSALAEKVLLPIKSADFPELFLGLSDVKRLEAEYLLSKNQSPLDAIEKGNQHLVGAFKINPTEPLIPQGHARFGLLKADWLIRQKQSPEETLAQVRAQLRKALDLNPTSALAFIMMAEASLKSIQGQSKQDPKSQIEEGLSAIQKSIQLNPDLAEAYSTQANLLLIGAQKNSDPTAKAQISADSVHHFEKAFAINPMLRKDEEQHFQEAKSLASTGPSPNQ